MLHANHKLTITAMTFSLVVASLFFLASCKSDEKKSSPEDTLAAPNFKLNCVILKKEQMQAWVDSGWTNPKTPDKLISKILLQFYSASAGNAGSNMQLATYPARTYTAVYAKGRADAMIDTTCTALVPTGKAIFGNSFLNLKYLKVIDSLGQLTDFTYIRLRPIQDRASYGDYITFKWEVVRIGPGATSTILNEGETSDPCPTFCEDKGNSDN